MNFLLGLQDLCVEAVQYLLSSYKSVPVAADSALRRTVRRYPCLVLPLLPYLLSATSNLPLPTPRELRASLDQQDQPKDKQPGLDLGFVQALSDKAAQGVALDNTTAPITASGASCAVVSITSSLSLLYMMLKKSP